MEDIRIGFGVFCGTEHVGHVAKFIADANDAHISDVVVDRGLLHGAKIISLGQVQDVRDGEVHLTLNQEQFQHADGFADQRFRYPGHTWGPPAGYASADFLLDVETASGSGAGYGPGPLPNDLALPPADPRPNLLRPVVKEGTAVRAADGEKVGEIASMSFHPDDGRLASVTMKWGLLDHERTEIPTGWIADLDDKGLTLSVSAAEVHQDRPAAQLPRTEPPG